MFEKIKYVFIIYFSKVIFICLLKEVKNVWIYKIFV